MTGVNDWRTSAIGLVRRTIPSRRQAFVAGNPATEGNVVEVVRSLLEMYAGDIYWPEAPSDAFLRAAGIVPSSRILRGPGLRSHDSLRAYLRSEIVFTSHGAYGMPATTSRRPVIDLWHGEYAKSGGPLYPGRTRRTAPSTVMISASKLLAPRKLAMAGMPSSSLIWVANPRVRQLRFPASDHQLARLGIDPERPFVLWLPTWRRGRDSVAGAVNTRNLAADESLASQFAREVGSVLERAGITLVVKPHSWDAESRATPGATVLSQVKLDDAAVPLYRLLGSAAGLVSDYSSVWIDYLSIDKPIGFFMPDRSSYDRGAGSSLTEAYECLPGPELHDQHSVEAFADDLLGADISSSLRATSRQHLGLWSGDQPARSLVEQLECRGLIRLG